MDDVVATLTKDKTEDILHTNNNATNNIKFTKKNKTTNLRSLTYTSC